MATNMKTPIGITWGVSVGEDPPMLMQEIEMITLSSWHCPPDISSGASEPDNAHLRKHGETIHAIP